MSKFPRIVNKKWKRYTKLEKVFILFLIVLFVLEFFLPFIKIEGNTYSFINTKFLTTSIILIFTLFFIIVWNVSYTFKNFIKSIFWFEQNEAILNFWVLFLHASLLIYTKDYISLLANTQSASLYTLAYWFYVLWWFIIIGLIWNLFLAIDISLLNNKKRTNYTKVVWQVSMNNDETVEKKDVKTLF